MQRTTLATTLAAALAAALLPLAAAPAHAATKCDTNNGIQICADPDSGAYELRNLRQPAIYVVGRCGGAVSWGDLPFPAVDELHRIMCGPNSNLQVHWHPWGHLPPATPTPNPRHDHPTPAAPAPAAPPAR